MAHMVVIIHSHLGTGMWDLGQVHQLVGAKGVRRRDFWLSIVPERCTAALLPGGRSVSSSCRSSSAKCGGDGAGDVVMSLISVMCMCMFLLSDVRPGYCYTALANGRCSNQLPQSITKMQCCCDVGRCWSPGVTIAPEMCPIRATGKSPSSYLQGIPTQPRHARCQCAWCGFNGNPGKWARVQKIKETMFRDSSPDSE